MFFIFSESLLLWYDAKKTTPFYWYFDLCYNGLAGKVKSNHKLVLIHIRHILFTGMCDNVISFWKCTLSRYTLFLFIASFEDLAVWCCKWNQILLTFCLLLVFQTFFPNPVPLITLSVSRKEENLNLLVCFFRSIESSSSLENNT